MPHQIVCRIRVDEPKRALEFTWSVGSSAFPTYALRDDKVERFRTNAQKARDRLFELVDLYKPPAAERDRPALRRSCLELAQAGRNLYNLIFTSASQPKDMATTVRSWLGEVTGTDGVQSLEVISEGQPWFAPWNLVYDADPDEDLFLKADPRADGGVDLPAAALRPFWGLRYNLCGGLPVEPLRRRRLPSPIDVLLVIDPVVRHGLARHVEEGVSQQARLLDFVAACVKTKARVATSRAELQKALKKRPHVIYWLGHANPSCLSLGDDEVSLDDLGDFLGDSGDIGPATSGGLVFLNACQTANSPDRGLGSFLNAFHDANFSGIIATEERTLDNVACPFGLEVMTAFLDQREPIGEVLRRLRTRYAPLGLLYGTYCPPDLQIRSDLPLAALDSVGQVNLGGAAEAKELGGGRAAVAWPEAEAEAAVQDHAELPPLPDEPYLPLASYGPEHRALFAGRDDDITRSARVLGRSETRALVLHGESGVGKSSFLNAGLIPYLDDVAVGFRFHGEDGKAGSVLFVRSTDDPAGQIAEALASFAAKPYRFKTPAGDERTVELGSVLARALGIEGPACLPAVREALLADPALLDRALGALGSAVPFTLVLVIDQAEEMFTLANPDGSGLADRDRVLRMLSRVGEGRGDYKVIVSLRTEFYGRLIGSLRQGPAGATGVRDYLLADLDRDALIAFVTRPTADQPIDHAREIPRERYRFYYAKDVPEALATELLRAGRKDGVLPLAQVICSQLWERVQARRPDTSARVVTHDDLAALGGFDGALRRHVDTQIQTIVPARRPARAWLLRTAQSVLPERFWTRETFQRLMADLTLSQADGTLTTAMFSERKLAEGYEKLEGLPFATLLRRANSCRLLRTTVRRGDDGAEERSVSLGHDALARVAFPWKQELEHRKRVVKWRLVGGVVLALMALFAGLSIKLHSQTENLRAQRENLRNSLARTELAEQNKAEALKKSEVSRKEADAINDFFTEQLVAQAAPENNSREPRPENNFDEPRPENDPHDLNPETNRHHRKFTVEELLDRWAAAVDHSFGGGPRHEAAIQQAIGRSYLRLGKPSKAEAHLIRTLYIRENVLGLGPDDPDTLHAKHNIAWLLMDSKKLDEAESLVRSVLKARKRVLGPADYDTLLETNFLARLLLLRLNLDDAEQLYQSNLELLRRVPDPKRKLTFDATNGVARVLKARGKLDEAEALFRANLDAERHVEGPELPQMLETIDNLASLVQDRGRPLEAERLFKQSLDAHRRVYGAEHPKTLKATDDLARLLRGRGKAAEAKQLYLENVDLTPSAKGADHPDTLAATDNRAWLLLSQGKLAEAEDLYRDNLARRSRVQGAEHNDTLWTMLRLASVLRLRKNYSESESLHRLCLRGRRRSSGPDNGATLVAMNNLAVLLQDRGKLDEAESLFRATLEARRRTQGLDHPDTLFSINNLANLLRVRGRAAEVVNLREETLKHLESKFGPDDPRTLQSRSDLASTYSHAGRYAEAIAMHSSTMKLRESKLGPDHPQTLQSRSYMAVDLRLSGRTAEAIGLLEPTLKLQESKLGPGYADTNYTRNALASAYNSLGRWADAIALLEPTLKLQESRLGPGHADTNYTRIALVTIYDSLGRWADAEALRRDVLAVRRKTESHESPILADALADLGRNLLEQSKWSEAEPILRECLAIRDKAIPGEWRRFNAMSLLGGALLGQGQFAEAEPLVIGGYEGMKAREATIPFQIKRNLSVAEKRVVQLYEEWGKPEQAKAWASKLGLADLPADVFARP